MLSEDFTKNLLKTLDDKAEECGKKLQELDVTSEEFGRVLENIQACLAFSGQIRQIIFEAQSKQNNNVVKFNVNNKEK